MKLDVNGITGWQGGTTGQTAQIVGASSGIVNGGNLRVLANTTQAANVGGALTFGGYYTSTTLSVDFGAILGAKENSTGGDAAGYLAFGTRPAGGNMTERMRIDSSGNVGIGTSSFALANRLNVKQTADNSATGLGFRIERNSNDSSLILGYRDNSDTWQINATYLSTGAFKPLTFLTSDTERMRIDASGNVGIGVPSISSGVKLDVDGSLQLRATGGEGGELRFLNIGNTSTALVVDVSTANVGRIFSTSNNSLLQIGQLGGTGGSVSIFTEANQRVLVDASGNMGVALTPIANNGILQLGSYGSVQALMEKATISATAATGTIAFDAATQAVLYYTSNASANWTLNVRGNSTTALNTIMQTGQSLTVAFLVTQGATPYYNTALQVDGASVTAKWQSNTAPTAGNASSIDVYTYTIIKTGSAAFTVLASQVQFK